MSPTQGLLFLRAMGLPMACVISALVLLGTCHFSVCVAQRAQRAAASSNQGISGIAEASARRLLQQGFSEALTPFPQPPVAAGSPYTNN